MRPNYRSGSIASPRCAASGHETEAAAAPPSSPMNSRRFTATGSHASDRKIAHLGSALLRCEISNGLLTALGHFRQIDPLPTLAAHPLRSDRVQTFAPQRIDAVCHEET